MLSWLLIFALAASATAQETIDIQDAIDYFDNSLAKVCRPLDKNLDLMFLLDGSGSVSGNTFDTQLRMVHRVIEQVDIGMNKTRIAILQYSGYTKVEIKFGESKNNEELLDRLDNIRHISGTTRTGKALRRARQLFSASQGARVDDPTVAQVIVVVGDGHSLDNPITASKEIRDRGIVLLTMGIGSYVNMNELIQMTEDESLAFNNETMDEFISTFRRIAVGEICDFAKGVDGAEVICGADSVEVNIMTQKTFHGHVYVPDYFKDDACRVSRGNVDDRSVSLRIPLNGCGVQEQFLFSPRGLLAETTVVLMYHPEYNSPKDKTFSIRCFYPDMRYHGKEGQEKKLFPHFSADNLKIQGNPLIASFPTPKMEMPCAYTLRRPDRSCVLEDAAVGDAFTHQWECDQSIIGEDYGFHIHSCYMVDGKEREMLVLDTAGCPVEKSLFGKIKYDNSGLRASAEGSFVKFADGMGVKFRCSVRFCNKANGECDILLDGKCDEVGLRSKRQVMKDMEGFMPPHMVERLFMRRHKTKKASNSSEEASGELPTDRFGRPLLTTFDNSNRQRQQGLPSVRAFRPIAQSARLRNGINLTPTKITPSSTASTEAATTTLEASTTIESTSTTPQPTTTTTSTTTAAPTTTTTSTTTTTTKAATTVTTPTPEPTTRESTLPTDLPTMSSLDAETTLGVESSEEDLALFAAAIVDSLASSTEAPESELKLSANSSIKEEKKPMMAGSVSFDDLVAAAIEDVEQGLAAVDGALADDAEPIDPALSEEYYEGEDDGTTAAPELASKDEEDKFRTIIPNPAVPTEKIPTLSPEIAALEEQLLQQELGLAEAAEEVLVEELEQIEAELNDAVADDIRESVTEGEMGMALEGLAVDIVAGLQLGQVQLESQMVRARPPPQNLPSPLNFCPRERY